MPIPEPKDVPSYGRNGNAPRIIQPHLEPWYRILVSLGEEMPHDRSNRLSQLQEHREQCRCTSISVIFTPLSLIFEGIDWFERLKFIPPVSARMR